MTYQVSVSGHSSSKDAEARVIDAFREAVQAAEDDGEVYSGSVSTTHHGTVDLLANDQPVGTGG